MKTNQRYVLDVSLSKENLYCFCPYEGDIKGEFTVIVGMNIFTSWEEYKDKCDALWSPYGQEDVNAFVIRHPEILKKEAIKHESIFKRPST